jgi:hypothetical protein
MHETVPLILIGVCFAGLIGLRVLLLLLLRRGGRRVGPRSRTPRVITLDGSR